MGFDVNGVRFLLDASKAGVVFGTCAMLGRQEMHITTTQLDQVFRMFSIDLGKTGAEKILINDGAAGYSESFLKCCGAKEVVSFDNSDYEGATFVHDMNRDIPFAYHAQFDCVIDSGTLEHVFNIPVALRNCMKMVKSGGHFLSVAPCNNFMGHGFYQFSPEIFYGVFSERNGFTVERMFIFESRPNAQWYRVADPSKIGGRVELANSMMTYLLVQARRIREIDLCDITPQQSDYVPIWEDKIPSSTKRDHSDLRVNTFTALKGNLKRRVKGTMRHLPVESVRTPFKKPWYEPYE
ncbi:MAG: class I SAM-dependent methyltransferase [Desulfuromonadales bacterium]